MFTIYIDSPIPDLKKMKVDFLTQLQDVQDSIPNFQDFIDTITDIPLPDLLGLPDPIFYDYSNAIQELMEIIDAIKYQADTLTMVNIFKPLLAVLGGSLEDYLPKIPVLDFSIIEILNGEVQGLYSAVIEALKNGVKLPYLPLEMFENFSNYAKEALLATKMILVGYKELLITTMQDMIKDAMSLLDISGVLPELPSIPTIDDLKQIVLDAFPDYSSWYDIITNVDISEIISLFGLDLFLLPEFSFIPNFSNYEQYLMECFNQIKDYYLSTGLRIIVDFVENTLVVLDFSFPAFYITF